jgi:hypothetical protein
MRDQLGLRRLIVAVDVLHTHAQSLVHCTGHVLPMRYQLVCGG